MTRDPYIVSVELLAFSTASKFLVISGPSLAARAEAVRDVVEAYEQAPRFMLIQEEDARLTPFAKRLDLQLLRMLLNEQPSWCTWIEVHTLDLLSSSIAEIAVICDWLEAVNIEFILMRRLQSSFSPAELRVSACRVLEQERALPPLKEPS